MHHTPHQRLAIVYAVIGAIAFSLKAIVVKLAYRYGVDAITLIMLRMVFAMPFFVLLALWAGRGREALSVWDWQRLVLLGFTGYFLASTLDFMGLQYISASLERLIIYISPTLVLLLGLWLFNKAVSSKQWQAMAMSYLGIALVFGHELFEKGMSASTATSSNAVGGVWMGGAFVLASAVVYALYLVYSGEFVKRVGAMRLAGWATAVACVFCIIQFLILRPVSALEVAVPVIWLSIFNATVCTVLPVVMTMLAVERIGAGLVSQVGMIGPASTIAMGVLMLGEPFTVWTFTGTVLVMLGVYWVTRSTTAPVP